MSAEEYTSWCRPWMNSLIIKVLGAEFPKHIVTDRINRMWRPRDPLKVIPLSNGYYIASFTTREDRDYAFQEGPWMIEDHYLLVQRWRPNFNPWKADLQRRIAAWIRIPDLPMELYNVESLRRIGNMVGKTLKIDRSTSIYDKGGFARISVEIDLHKPLLPAFNAFGEDRPIIYEGLHLVCFHCGKYGHEKDKCPMFCHEELSKKDKEVKGNEKEEELQKGKEDVRMHEDSSGVTEEQTGRKNTAISPEQDTVEKKNTVYGNIQLLRRDFRGNKFISGTVGIKNVKVDNNKGKEKITDVNHGGGYFDLNKQVSFGKVSKSVDLNKRSGRDIEKSTEWVAVGSKRKNELKIQAHGKDNKYHSRVKASLRNMGHQNRPILMSNHFSALQSVSSIMDLNEPHVPSLEKDKISEPGPSKHENNGLMNGSLQRYALGKDILSQPSTMEGAHDVAMLEYENVPKDEANSIVEIVSP